MRVVGQLTDLKPIPVNNGHDLVILVEAMGFSDIGIRVIRIAANNLFFIV